jgi:hypothetical protein
MNDAERREILHRPSFIVDRRANRNRFNYETIDQ